MFMNFWYIFRIENHVNNTIASSYKEQENRSMLRMHFLFTFLRNIELKATVTDVKTIKMTPKI